MALTWDDINSNTTEYIVPNTYDVFFESSPIFTRLRTKNAMMFEGGTFIKVPLIYDELNGGSYAKGADFSTIVKPGRPANTGIEYVQTDTAMTFKLKGYEVNVTLYGEDAIIENGPETVLKSSERKLINAAGTMAKMISTDFWKGASGVAGDSPVTAVDGFARALNNGAAYPGTGFGLPAYPTYGEINRLTDWPTPIAAGTNNKLLNGGVFQSAAVGIVPNDELQNAYGAATFGNQQPDLIVTSQSMFNKISNVQLGMRRYLEEDVDVCKVGFRALRFNAAAIVVDQYAPEDVVWLLNTNYIQLWTSKINKYSFGWTGWKSAPNTDNQVAQYLWHGNIVVNNPRAFSVIDAS